jgi:glycosyltransferase involved in cell wall biosynthesis
MMSYTMSCDAGLSLDTDTCLNQRYSLPNKLFDYIAAGIPVIASPLPEISALVSEYSCGIVLKAVSPELIAETLKRLRGDSQYLSQLKAGAKAAARELNWETEKIKEQELIKRVIKENIGNE